MLESMYVGLEDGNIQAFARTCGSLFGQDDIVFTIQRDLDRDFGPAC